jgi:hypothetical protein
MIDYRRRVVSKIGFSTSAAIAVKGSSVSWANLAQSPSCQLPEMHVLRTKISSLAPAERFEPIIKNLAPHPIFADFGSGLYDSQPIGIPINYVEQIDRRSTVEFVYADESDKAEYPIPLNPLIEGGPKSTGDRHILVCMPNENRIYELFDAHQVSAFKWRAGSGAIFDLDKFQLRPDSFTSADAAGLPIAPLLVKYEEVAAGSIEHALRFTTDKTARRYLWPARHFASRLNTPTLPPMGLRLRLKANFDSTRFPPQARVVLKALKEYGMVLADNGSPYFISGTPDERWNNSDLATLKRVPISAFEAVDSDVWMTDRNSGFAKR